MKVIVVGLGSMGKRRIRLIQKFNKDIEIIGVDSKPERRRETEELYNITTAESLDIAIESGAKCAFICTSPLSHAAIINKCLNSNLHVFTELNLVSDLYKENIELAKRKGLILFLSSTFIYRDEVKYIKSKSGEVDLPKNYIYHIGQYLPDWHPWENYKEYFVGNKRTNGCREIFAIELPWLTDIFGNIVDFKVTKAKSSSFNIDYNDTYLLLIEHESNTHGMLAVDVISRKAVRNFELYSENCYISWNGSPDGLYEYDFHGKQNNSVTLYDKVDKQEGYSSFIIENAYYNEVCSFFDAITGKFSPVYSFENDLKILNLIDKIEASDEEV